MKKLLLGLILGSVSLLAQSVNVSWNYDATKWPVTTPAMVRTYALERTTATAGVACASLASATTWVSVANGITPTTYTDTGVIAFNSYCHRVRAVGTWPASGTVPAGSANSTWAYSLNAVTVTPTIPPPTGVDAQVPTAIADVVIRFNGQQVADLKLPIPAKVPQP